MLTGWSRRAPRRRRSRSIASTVTDPEKFKEFQDAQNQLSGALGRLLAISRELSRPQVEPELPRPAVAARGHREPHRGGAARLHRGGAGSTIPSCAPSRAAGSRRSSIPSAKPMETFTATPSTDAPPKVKFWDVSRRMRPADRRERGRSHCAYRRLARGSGVILVVLPSAPAAALTFPALTGRVVDAAGILPADGKARARGQARGATRTRSRDQMVVATVPILQGTEIEDYGNRLFRAWEIGQKGMNNGVAADRRAERAQGPDRGRLRPRGRAHRRAVQGHHHPARRRAQVQGRATCRRHRGGRRRDLASAMTDENSEGWQRARRRPTVKPRARAAASTPSSSSSSSASGSSS